MKINKTSEKYNFYPDGVNYVLDFGQIKNGEKPTVELVITDLIDSNLLYVKPTCSCTSISKEIVNQTTQKIKLTYLQCDTKISKITEVRYNNVKVCVIKLIGACQ